MSEEEGRCLVCGSTEGLQTYGVQVDGEPLSLQPILCAEHGGNFLVRVGMVMATLKEPIERVFVSEAQRSKQ